MPARDHLHAHVRATLERDGWTITHDPLRLRWRNLLVFNAEAEVIERWTPEPPTAQ